MLAAGVDELGRLDVVIANAGIATFWGSTHELSGAIWREMIDINLTGAWATCKAAVPHILAHGDGGSIVLVSSVAGLHAFKGCSHYGAAKTGLIGLMRTLALELGPSRIRVNSIHPTQVDTPMVMNDAVWRLFQPDAEELTREGFASASQRMHVLPEPWVDPVDISNAILFLASDEGRYITGVPLPIDLGADLKA